MNIELAYGGKRLSVTIPGGTRVDHFEPRRATSPVDFDNFARRYRRELAERLSDGNLLIVVNDGYRSTPTALILDWLNRIDGSILDRAELVIATGIHGSPTDNHLIEIFGPLLDRVRSRVAWHDARDILSMRAVGNDSFGETVYLNNAVFQADTVLAIGSVEPHYFAGYTGGRKSLFPGLCDFATTERNHNLANSLDAQPMRLDGNPVAEHLASLLRLIDTERVVTIQAVQDISHQLAGIAMGSLERAFHEMVTTARKFYGHAVGDPYDVVVCEMNPPLDSNLYQGQKAIENSQHAVADSGAIVLISACTEGIGSEHFFALADNWDPQRNEPRDGHFSYGSHKLSRMNAMSRRIHIHLYSDVPAADARRVFYEPIEDLSEFLENEAKGKGQFRLAVVHDAGHTVVKLN